MNVSNAQLGDVAEFINGVAFKPQDWSERGRRIIRIQNLTDPEKPFNRTEREVPSKYHVQPNDLLVSWSASLGVFEWSGPDTALLNQHIFKVVLKNGKADRQYFKHALNQALTSMQRHLHGATMQHVNRDEFLSTKFPLPSISEQRRIAAILDKADRLRAQSADALQRSANLVHSVFHEMFGNPVTNNKRWDVAKLIEISEFENGDRSSNYPSGDEIKNEGILFLSTRNIVDDKLELSSASFITGQKFKSLSRGKARKNDLIITLRGTLGSCCIFDCKYDTAFINAQMMIVRPRREGTHRYLHSLLTSKEAKSRFARIGQGAAVPQLTGAQLAELTIPFPPIHLQREFAVVADATDKLSVKTRNSLVRLDLLFASLQHRAFGGEL